MPRKPPMKRVVEEHGSKEKLVEKLVGVLDRGEETKEELKARLLAAPNSKLLRLWEITREVRERFGSKEKLVDALLELLNRSRDKDYREKLLTCGPGRLLDLYRVRARKARTAGQAQQAGAGA